MPFNFLSPLKSQKTASTYKFSFRAKIITLWVVAAIVCLFLYRFSHVLPVFIWAAVTAYLFTPVIIFLSRQTRLPRAAWVVILYLVVGLLLFATIKSITPQISTEIADLVNVSLDDQNTFLGRVAAQGTISIFGLEFNSRDQVINFSIWLKAQVPTHFFPIFFSAIEKLVFLLIYLVVTFYLILDAGKYIILLKRVIPIPYRQELFNLLENINLTLGAYIRAQVVLIFIMSFASFLVLSLLRIKYALILSITTGILEVIPIAGPILATTIAATVALFQASSSFGLSNLVLALIIIIAYFVLRQIEDYFIIPNVVSKFVKVHPVVAIFALIVGGTVAGVLGLFLAIPTAAIVLVLSNYIYRKLTED